MTDEDKPRFLQAFNRLAVGLREQSPDVVPLRVYFEALKDLEIELVDAAADRLMQSAQWFPKVPEWRAMVTTIRRERVEAQREWLRKAPRPLCAICADTGWELVTGVVYEQEVTQAQPCWCRDARRRELLGLVPAPTLPSLPEPIATAIDVEAIAVTVAKGHAWPE